MRARNIKPGFFINENLLKLKYEERILFMGLWCIADREGFFENRPKQIKLQIFPDDNRVNIQKMLCNLMSLHLITCDNEYGYVPNFEKHQRPHPHEAKSTVPEAVKKTLKNQCHDMSLNVMKCPSDIRNDDIRNDDTMNEDIWSFGLFWKAWPKKVAREKAMKAFKAIKGDKKLLTIILEAIELQKQTEQWQKEDGKYIPHPATWLNQRRWEDEVHVNKQTQKETGKVLF